MSSEKMSIHRGLSEIKLLGDRIEKAIEKGIYCTHNKRSNQKIQGMDIQDFRNTVIKADYDKVESLLERRQKIKSAIVKSNALTGIEIAGNKMVVAEAIDRKNSIENDKYFLEILRQQYAQSIRAIERNNETLTQKADEQINLLYSNKDNIDPVKIKSLKEDYINENTFDFIDPLDIKEKMEKLEREIEDFELEVDFKLSESNSLTFIEI